MRFSGSESDVLGIERIAREAFEESFSVEAELNRPWSRLWIARSSPETEVVGFLIAWHVADELHVLNVASASTLRRRGIGAALMKHAVDYAATSRVRLVLLEVRRSNVPAIRLYRKLGFSAVSVRSRYYGDGEDAVEMLLSLDPSTGFILPSQDEVPLEC